MSRWYRAYEGTVTDAKLHEAAMVAGVSRSVSIATWHAVLEACAAAKSARFDTTPRRIAVILGEPLSAIEGLFAAYAELGMIEDGEATAWGRRQFESDTSTERSRKHREAKRNVAATLQQQDATPPYTETDTETERERERAPAPSELASDFVPDPATAIAQGVPIAEVPKVAAKFTAHQREKRAKSADWRASWLKWCLREAEMRGWQPPSASAQPRAGPEIYIHPDDDPDPWQAWAKHRGKPLPTDKNGGWTVPSKYPPDKRAPAPHASR